MKNISKFTSALLETATIMTVAIIFPYYTAGAILEQSETPRLVTIIDGKNIPGDFGNAAWETYQNTVTDWGDNKILAMYLMTNDTHLLIGIPGYIENNSLVVFLDVNKDTGSNAIPAGLSWPERVKGMAGMRFDDTFTPDKAVSVGINEGRTEGWVHLENIVDDSTLFLGTMTGINTDGCSVTNGGILVGATINDPPVDTSKGIEIALGYDSIGNNTRTVSVMAIIANLGGDWASNQALPPAGGNYNWVSGPAYNHNASLVPGYQFITIVLPPVRNNDESPHIATNALVFPAAGSVMHKNQTTNVLWNPLGITDDNDGNDLTISKISILESGGLSEISIVATNILNNTGTVKIFVPDDLSYSEKYYMQFEVVNSSSLTNNRIFYDNSFTVIPEPNFCLLQELFILILVCRVNKNKM